jgi:hypothetical protein
VGNDLILPLIQQMSHFLSHYSVQLERCFASIFEVLAAFSQGDSLQLRPLCAHSLGHKVPKLIFSVVEDPTVNGKYWSHFNS